MIIVPTLKFLLGFALGQGFSGYPQNSTFLSAYTCRVSHLSGSVS